MSQRYLQQVRASLVCASAPARFPTLLVVLQRITDEHDGDVPRHVFGNALHLSDDESSLVVGSPGSDDDEGAVFRHACSHHDGRCGDQTRITPDRPRISSDRFGHHVHQDGSACLMAVGAPGSAGGYGAAHLWSCVGVVCDGWRVRGLAAPAPYVPVCNACWPAPPPPRCWSASETVLPPSGTSSAGTCTCRSTGATWR